MQWQSVIHIHLCWNFHSWDCLFRIKDYRIDWYHVRSRIESVLAALNYSWLRFCKQNQKYLLSILRNILPIIIFLPPLPIASLRTYFRRGSEFLFKLLPHFCRRENVLGRPNGERTESNEIYWCFICFVVTLSLWNGYGITEKIDSHAAANSRTNSIPVDPFDISIHSETAQITTSRIFFFCFGAQQIYTACPYTQTMAVTSVASSRGGGSGNSGDFRAFECFISRSVHFISNIDIIKIGMDSRLSGKWFRDREREAGRMRLGKKIKYYGQFIRHNGFRLHFYVFICSVFWFIDFYSGTEPTLKRVCVCVQFSVATIISVHGNKCTLICYN